MTIKKQRAGLIYFSATIALMLPAICQGEESLTGNVSATSTYIWRGVAQTNNAALQGGMHFNLASNAYAGAWTSTRNGGSEIDLYGGYRGQADVFNYDAGVIAYQYPNDGGLDLNFIEVYADINRDFYGAKISLSSEAGTYIEGYATIPIEHWELGLHVGRYTIEADYAGFTSTAITDDYFDLRFAMSKDVGGFDLEFAISDTNLAGDNGNFRTAITASKNFIP